MAAPALVGVAFLAPLCPIRWHVLAGWPAIISLAGACWWVCGHAGWCNRSCLQADLFSTAEEVPANSIIG